MNAQRLSREGVGDDFPEMVATYYFYTLLCPFSNVIKYVGRTVNPQNRLRNHIYEAKKNNRNKRERWIVSLLRKNKAPIMRVLWQGSLTLDQAIATESALIRRFRKTHDLKNEDDRGLGGKISTRTVFQYTLDGDFVASYLNSNQAAIATGVKDCNIARCCKNQNGYGTKTAGDFFWSFVRYDKYPHKYIKEWKKLKGKPVFCINESGERLEFATARQAERELGVNYKHISAVCNGKRKTAGGLVWSFVC